MFLYSFANLLELAKDFFILGNYYFFYVKIYLMIYFDVLVMKIAELKKLILRAEEKTEKTEKESQKSENSKFPFYASIGTTAVAVSSLAK